MSEAVSPGPNQYNQDGLMTIHNHDFMESPTFKAAYQRGVKAAGTDYHWHWGAHIGLWAAAMASKLAGDFVECGVNRGFLSSAIMHFLDWDSIGKQFYLLDTFRGIHERYVSNGELASGVTRPYHNVSRYSPFGVSPSTVLRTGVAARGFSANRGVEARLRGFRPTIGAGPRPRPSTPALRAYDQGERALRGT